MNQEFVIQTGMDVFGTDGEKVGEVDGVEQNHFIVRKGFFFPQDHFIPMTAVASVDEANVYLNVFKDEALELQWTEIPEGTVVPESPLEQANEEPAATEASEAPTEPLDLDQDKSVADTEAPVAPETDLPDESLQTENQPVKQSDDK